MCLCLVFLVLVNSRKVNSVCLSSESSIEKNFYKDSSGCDLEEFIKKTLVKSKKDKQMLLSLERDFKIFVDSQ